ncbi:MAG: hypothetical protein ACFFA1_05065 [Promethearchaeota archaeon]
MKKKTKQIMTLALLLTAAVSLLAASLPVFLDNEYEMQLNNKQDAILISEGSGNIEYVGPPAPERYYIGVHPPYQDQKPILRDPRIIFWLLDGIRPFPVNSYYII